MAFKLTSKMMLAIQMAFTNAIHTGKPVYVSLEGPDGDIRSFTITPGDKS